MIVDGRAITKDILEQVRASAAGLPHVPVVRAIAVAPSAATESYLRVKKRRAKEAGMSLDIVRLPDQATTEDIIEALKQEGADALLVQLPLPSGVATEEVLNAIPTHLDADVLSKAAHHAFEQSDDFALLPPVVAAVKEILERAGVNPSGKRAVVVGKGWLVGEPVATWLVQSGATVTSVGKDEGLGALLTAEIIVSGAGSPGIITPDLIAPGVVLIDAGTSESGGSIVGDADPSCGEVAGVFTPVPGGVGPIAVACLFRNVLYVLTRDGLRPS